MNCGNVEKNISRYLDGKLPEKTKRAMAEHIGQCQQCRARIDEMVLLKEQLRGLGVVNPSAAFEPSFFQALDENWEQATSIKPSVFERIGFALEDVFFKKRFKQAAFGALPVLCSVLLFVFVGIPSSHVGVDVVRVDGQASFARVDQSRGALDSGVGQAVFSRLGRTDDIGENCVVRTGGDGKLRMVVDGKFTLDLASRSELFISPRKNGSYVLKLASGMVAVNTNKKFKGSNLSVVSAFSNTRVVGTSFMVYAWSGGCETRVFKGTVSVQPVDSANGGAVRVSAGHKTEVLEGRPAASPTALINSEVDTARNTFKFTSRPDTSSQNNYSVDSRRSSSGSTQTKVLPSLF